MESVNASVPSESALVDEIRDRLVELGLQLLPAQPSTPHTRDRPDLMMIAPTRDGVTTVAIDVRLVTGPRSNTAVSRLAVTGRVGHDHRILGLPHISPSVRQHLEQLDIDFVDSGGNARIRLPGFQVDVQGRTPRLTAVAGTDRPSRAFRPAGMRVVFSLLIQPALLTAPVREVSAVTGVSVGAVHNTMKDLREEGLVASTSSQTLLTNPLRLTRRWLEHFESGLRPALNQRALNGPEPTWWRSMISSWTEETRPQLGGEAAAELAGYGLRATTTTLYASPPWHDLIRAGRLVPDQSPNVFLRERFWDPVVVGGGEAVPSLLVYADLVASGDPRQHTAAEEVWDRDADLRRLRQG